MLSSVMGSFRALDKHELDQVAGGWQEGESIGENSGSTLSFETLAAIAAGDDSATAETFAESLTDDLAEQDAISEFVLPIIGGLGTGNTVTVSSMVSSISLFIDPGGLSDQELAHLELSINDLLGCLLQENGLVNGNDGD